MSKAVISIIASDRPGLVHELSELIHRLNLNIDDSRMTVLGGEFAILMLVTGNENAIANLEKRLPKFATDTGVTFIFRSTKQQISKSKHLCCHVSISAMDHPGIVRRVAEFFSNKGLNIRSIETKSQPAAHTGSPVFNLEMLIDVKGGNTLGILREEFFEFCAEEDLDGDFGIERPTK